MHFQLILLPPFNFKSINTMVSKINTKVSLVPLKNHNRTRRHIANHTGGVLLPMMCLNDFIFSRTRLSLIAYLFIHLMRMNIFRYILYMYISVLRFWKISHLSHDNENRLVILGSFNIKISSKFYQLQKIQI